MIAPAEDTNVLIRLSAAQHEHEKALRAAMASNDKVGIEAAADRLLQVAAEVIVELDRVKELFSTYALTLSASQRSRA